MRCSLCRVYVNDPIQVGRIKLMRLESIVAALRVYPSGAHRFPAANRTGAKNDEITLARVRHFDRAPISQVFGTGGAIAGVSAETLTVTGSGTLAAKNVGNQGCDLLGLVGPGERHGGSRATTRSSAARMR
jgi:hypothetical protein